MDKSVKFWNKISANYDKQVKDKYSNAYDATISKTKKYLNESDRVLDFACGTGITTIELSKMVKEIYAIDISESMINIARDKIKDKDIHNIKYGVFDIMNENLELDSFDVVLGFNILYFIDDIEGTLNRIYELLKTDGIFISVTDCLGENITIQTRMNSFFSKLGLLPYIRQYKMAELEGVIKNSGFTIIESENLYKNPPNYYLVGRK